MNFKKTVISYDKGTTWSPLKSPQFDSENNELECDGECSLHLLGPTNQLYPQPLSNSQSIGVIIASGNIGHYLANNYSHFNTYLSRDGGFTWYEIKKGSYFYEISDNAGLIVMIEKNKPTNNLIYSWDEGLSWESFEFIDIPINIIYFERDKKKNSQKFLFVGLNAKNKTLIFQLDFSSLNIRECNGMWDPINNDYEIWVPNNRMNNECFFGKSIKYTRKKRESRCFNKFNDKNMIIKYCECTETDFQCDYGFYKPPFSNECKPMNHFFEISEEKPKNCNHTYEVKTGYRKIPGNQCKGGINKNIKILNCSNNIESNLKGNFMEILINEKNHHSLYILGIFIGFLIVFFIIVCLVKKESILVFFYEVFDRVRKKIKKILKKKDSNHPYQKFEQTNANTDESNQMF